MEGYIYRWTNKANGKMYIGQTINLKRRIRDYECMRDGKVSRILKRAISKYGIENFMFDILDTANTIDKLNYKEEKYINALNTTTLGTGYNLDSGGKNHTASPETRKKISKAGMGRKPWNTGIKHPFSQEVLDRMSRKRKGVPPWNKGKKTGAQSKELIEKRIRPLRGRKIGHHSEERKAKISASRKGIFITSDKYKHRNKIREENDAFIQDFNTGKIEQTLEAITRYNKIAHRRNKMKKIQTQNGGTE